jgi:hypothetical protein
MTVMREAIDVEPIAAGRAVEVEAREGLNEHERRAYDCCNRWNREAEAAVGPNGSVLIRSPPRTAQT